MVDENEKDVEQPQEAQSAPSPEQTSNAVQATPEAATGPAPEPGSKPGATANGATEPIAAVGKTTEPPPPRKAKSRSGGTDRVERNQKILIGLAIAILAVVVVASCVGLAFGIHGRRANRMELNRGGAMQQLRQRGQRLMNRGRQLLENGEASIIRGKVTAVDGNSVTVDTGKGNQTVSTTGKTRYLGVGSTGGNPGLQLTVGEQVSVFAKKGSDGKLEAALIRIGATTQQQAPIQAPVQ
ncbi:MAG TPA: DUF5666 domain-containing protein [Candidatus Anoxymicrobiaceae bacterium]